MIIINFYRAPFPFVFEKYQPRKLSGVGYQGGLAAPLISIIFSEQFNEPIATLPPTLTHLDLSITAFNQPVDSLPSSLTHISFGLQFNQSIDHLPNGLTHLSIAASFFDHPVNHLPPSLIHLDFSCSSIFNQRVDLLPTGLKQLYFNGMYVIYLFMFLTVLQMNSIYQLTAFPQILLTCHLELISIIASI